MFPLSSGSRSKPIYPTQVTLHICLCLAPRLVLHGEMLKIIVPSERIMIKWTELRLLSGLDSVNMILCPVPSTSVLSWKYVLCHTSVQVLCYKIPKKEWLFLAVFVFAFWSSWFWLSTPHYSDFPNVSGSGTTIPELTVCGTITGTVLYLLSNPMRKGTALLIPTTI